MIERRSEERREVNESAFMQLLNSVDSERVPVTIVNKSKRGICIACHEFLPRGAEVRVFAGCLQFFGKISYCVALTRARGFRAGIEIAGKIQYPAHQFEPAKADSD